MTDVSVIVNGLIKDANIFYSKAQTYKNYREVDGTLVNLLLSANNLNKAIEIISKNDEQDQYLSELTVLNHLPGSNNLQVDSCDKTVKECLDKLKEILLQVLNETKEVQLHLRQVKSSGKSSGVSGSSKKGSGKNSSSGNEKDDQGIKCENIKDQNVECVLFSDIIGAENAKKRLEEAMIYPYKYPNLYKSRGKSLLLYGPPGTGKTFMVKAAVNELKNQLPEITVKWRAPTGADLKGKYVGETEKRITSYFECAARDACVEEKNIKDLMKKDTTTRNITHKRVISILFLDEVEAIAGSRILFGQNMTSSVNTLLQMMDGITSSPNVFVIAATNYPWQLDGAVLRRFQERIFFDLPNKKEISGLLVNNIANQFVINGREYLVRYDKDRSNFVEDDSNGNFIMNKITEGTYEDDVEEFCKKKLEEIDQEKEKDDDSSLPISDNEGESETGTDKKWEEKFLKDLENSCKRDNNNTPDPDMYDVSKEKIDRLFSSNVLEQIKLSKNVSSMNPFQAKNQFKKLLEQNLVNHLYDNLFSQDDLKNFILKANKWASSQSTGDDISFYECQFKSNKDSEFGKTKTYCVPSVFVNKSNSSIRKPKKVLNSISGSDTVVNRFKDDHSINIDIFTTKNQRYVLEGLSNEPMSGESGTEPDSVGDSKACKEVEIHLKDDCQQINKLTMKFINSDYVKDSEYFEDIELYNQIDTFYLASAEYNQKIVNKEVTAQEPASGQNPAAPEAGEQPVASGAPEATVKLEGAMATGDAVTAQAAASDVSNFMFNSYVIYQLKMYLDQIANDENRDFIEGCVYEKIHRENFVENFKDSDNHFLLLINKDNVKSMINPNFSKLNELLNEFGKYTYKYLILKFEGDNIVCKSKKFSDGSICHLKKDAFKVYLKTNYTHLFNICDIPFNNDNFVGNVTEKEYYDMVDENKKLEVMYLPSFSQTVDRLVPNKLDIPLQYYKVHNIIKFLKFIISESYIESNILNYTINLSSQPSGSNTFTFDNDNQPLINEALEKLRLKLIKPRFYGNVNISNKENPRKPKKTVEDKLYNNIFDNVGGMYNKPKQSFKYIGSKFLIKSNDTDPSCHKFITSKDYTNKQFCAELNILKKNPETDCIFYNHINNFIPQDGETNYYATHDIFVNKNKENKSDLIIQNYLTIEVILDNDDDRKKLPKIYDTVVISNDTEQCQCQILSREKLSDNTFKLSIDMEEFVVKRLSLTDSVLKFNNIALSKNDEGDKTYKVKNINNNKNPFYILPILVHDNNYDYSILNTVNNITNGIDGKKKITEYINFLNQKSVREIFDSIENPSIDQFEKEFLQYYLRVCYHDAILALELTSSAFPLTEETKSYIQSIKEKEYKLSHKNLLIKNSNSENETEEVDFGILNGIFDREDRDGDSWDNINYFTNNIYLLNLIDNNYQTQFVKDTPKLDRYKIVQKYVNDICIVVQDIYLNDGILKDDKYSIKLKNADQTETYGISIKSIILANVSDDFVGENFVDYTREIREDELNRIVKFVKDSGSGRETIRNATAMVTKAVPKTEPKTAPLVGGVVVTPVAVAAAAVAVNATANATGAVVAATGVATTAATGAAVVAGFPVGVLVATGVVVSLALLNEYRHIKNANKQQHFFIPNGKQYFDLDFDLDFAKPNFKEDVIKNLNNLNYFVNICSDQSVMRSGTWPTTYKMKKSEAKARTIYSINYDQKDYQVDTYLEDKKNKYHFVLNRLKSSKSKPIYFLRKKQSIGINVYNLKAEQAKIIRKMEEREKIERGVDNSFKTGTKTSKEMIDTYCDMRDEAGIDATRVESIFRQLTSMNKICYDKYLEKKKKEETDDLDAYKIWKNSMSSRDITRQEERGKELYEKNFFNSGLSWAYGSLRGMWRYSTSYGSNTSMTYIKDKVQKRIDYLEERKRDGTATGDQPRELEVLKKYQLEYLKNSIEETSALGQKWFNWSASSELDKRKERNNISGMLAKTQDPAKKIELKQKMDMLDNELYNLSESKKIRKSIKNIVPNKSSGNNYNLYDFCDLFRNKNISNILEIVNSSYYLFLPFKQVTTKNLDEKNISYQLLMIDSPDNQEDFINLTNDFLLEDDTCDLHTQIKFKLSLLDDEYTNDILCNYFNIKVETPTGDTTEVKCNYKNSVINYSVKNKFNTLYFNSKNNYNLFSSVLDMNSSIMPNYYLVNMVDMISNKDIFTPNVNGEFKAVVNDLFKEQLKFNNLEGYGRLLKLKLIEIFSSNLKETENLDELKKKIIEEKQNSTEKKNKAITDIEGYAQILNKNMIVPYDDINPLSGISIDKLSVIIPKLNTTTSEEEKEEYKFINVYDNNFNESTSLKNNNEEQHFCIKIDDMIKEGSNQLPTSTNMKFPDYIFTDELDIYSSVNHIKFTKKFVNYYKSYLEKTTGRLPKKKQVEILNLAQDQPLIRRFLEEEDDVKDSDFLTGEDLNKFTYIYSKLINNSKTIKKVEPQIENFTDKFPEIMDSICDTNKNKTLEDVILNYFFYNEQSIGLLQFLRLFNPKEINEELVGNGSEPPKIKYGTFIKNIYEKVLKRMIPQNLGNENNQKLKFGFKVIHGSEETDNLVNKNFKKFTKALTDIDISKSKLDLCKDDTLIYEKDLSNLKYDDKNNIFDYQNNDIVIVDMSKFNVTEDVKTTATSVIVDKLKNYKYLSFELSQIENVNKIRLKNNDGGNSEYFNWDWKNHENSSSIIALDVIKMCKDTEKKKRINEICQKYAYKKLFEFDIFNEKQYKERTERDKFMSGLLSTISLIPQIKETGEITTELSHNINLINSIYIKLYEKLKIFDKTLNEIDMSPQKIYNDNEVKFVKIYEKLQKKLQNICLENMINMAYNPDFNCYHSTPGVTAVAWKDTGDDKGSQIPGRLAESFQLPTEQIRILVDLADQIETTQASAIDSVVEAGAAVLRFGAALAGLSGGGSSLETSNRFHPDIKELSYRKGILTGGDINGENLGKSVDFLDKFEKFNEDYSHLEQTLKSNDDFINLVKKKEQIEEYVKAYVKMLSDQYSYYLNIYKNIFENDYTIIIEPEDKFTEYKNLLRFIDNTIELENAIENQTNYYKQISDLTEVLHEKMRQMDILDKVEKMSVERLKRQLKRTRVVYAKDEDIVSLKTKLLKYLNIDVPKIQSQIVDGLESPVNGIYLTKEFINIQIKNIEIVKVTTTQTKKLQETNENLIAQAAEAHYLTDLTDLQISNILRESDWTDIIKSVWLEKFDGSNAQAHSELATAYEKHYRAKAEPPDETLETAGLLPMDESTPSGWLKYALSNDKETFFKIFFEMNSTNLNLFVKNIVIKIHENIKANIDLTFTTENLDKSIINDTINKINKIILLINGFKTGTEGAPPAATIGDNYRDNCDKIIKYIYLIDRIKEKIFSLYNENCKNIAVDRDVERDLDTDKCTYKIDYNSVNLNQANSPFLKNLSIISKAIETGPGQNTEGLKKQYKNLSEILDELKKRISTPLEVLKEEQLVEKTLQDIAHEDDTVNRSWLGNLFTGNFRMFGGGGSNQYGGWNTHEHLHILSSVDNFDYYCNKNIEEKSDECITGKELYCKKGITTYTELENKSSKNTQFKDGEIIPVQNMDKKKRVFHADPNKMFEIHIARPLAAKKPTGDKSALIWEAKSSIIKEDYAQMLYYEDTKLDPTDKERKKKAYDEAAKGTYTPDRGVENGKCKWAKDLKLKDDDD